MVIMVVSDDDSFAEPNIKSKHDQNKQSLEKKLADLEKENNNVRIHCEVFQARVREQSSSAVFGAPVASSTMNCIYDADKENSKPF